MGSPRSITWVPGLPLDTSALPLQLAVIESDDGSPGASPFVALGEGSRYSWVYLARLALPDGSTIKRLAVKIQRHTWRAPTGGLSARVADNPEVEAMWARERENLVASQGPGVVPFFDLLANGQSMAPVTYCKRRRVLFEPPSPQTGARLEVCKDDAFLRECGLEPYTESSTRYLFSPRQREVGGGDPLTFYTWSTAEVESPRNCSRVRRRGELYRDLAALCHSEAPGDQCDFPCLSCEHRSECYPSADGDAPIPAEEHLIPLSYYPSPVLVTEVQDLRFDDWCDLLGGADRRPTAANRTPPSPGLLGTDTGPQFFFQGSKGPDFALEVLHLKLLACRQVCAGLRAYQQSTARPHLGIAPDNIMVALPDAGGGLPRRWQFATNLLDLGAQHRFLPPGRGDTELLLPAPDAPASFQSPFVDPAAFGQELTMQLTIQSAVEADSGQILKVDAKAQGSRVAGPRPGDVVSIEAHGNLPGLGEVILAGIVDKVQPAGAQFSVQLTEAQRVAADVLPFTCGGSVTFFRRFQSPCDLFGLGMLFGRALLVNDKQDLFQAEDSMRQVLDKLELAVAGVEEPDHAYIVTTLGNLLEEVHFANVAVLYKSEDRIACVPDVPDPSTQKIWFDTLVLLFRLMTNLKQFSFCAHHGDYDLADPSSVAAAVEDEVEQLLRRSQVELFGQRARGREIAHVCDGLLTEINAQLYGQEEPS